MKPGKNDIKAKIKFEPDELELLQENTWQMAESFGLDRRIDNMTGKRKVGFYSWDLDCLECVVSDLQKSPKNKEVADRIARKIETALMKELVPLLKKLAQGREISGLAAYE